MTNNQEWFNQEFPQNSEKIDASYDYSAHSLTVKNYSNLKVLEISDCQLENLTIENCPKLGSLNVSNNKLTNLNFLKNLPNLQSLEIDGNKEIKSGWEYLPVNLEKENFTYTNTNELLTLQVKYRKLKNSVKDILTHLIKNKHSLTTQEVLNQFSHYDSTKEIITNLASENKSLVQEYQWYKPQFAPQAPVLIKKLGSGAFGEVWQGNWKTQPVAIKKTLHLDENMKEELKLLRDLKSKYIIQYYGEYQQEQEWLIIMEYAEQGSLKDFIDNQSYTWKEVADFIKQMTQGLAYLHCEGVIHCDLKSLNVLLTENQVAKLSDFGISQIITKKIAGQRKAAGTTRWMAPELLVDNDQPNSFQSDIYSLGMVFWELAAKCTIPFQDLPDNLIITRALAGYREEIPADTPQVLKEIITGCWQEILHQRISLANIESKITKLINQQEPQLETAVEIPPKK